MNTKTIGWNAFPKSYRGLAAAALVGFLAACSDSSDRVSVPEVPEVPEVAPFQELFDQITNHQINLSV